MTTRYDAGCDMDTLPSALELFEAYSFEQTMIFTTSVVIFFGIFVLSVVQIYYVWNFVESEHKRNKLYILCTSYPTIAAICVCGLVSPRSSSALMPIGILVILFAIYNVVSLPRVIYGTREEMSIALCAEDIKVKLQTPPLCCCMPCLPKLKPTARKILMLERMVFQATIVRIVIVIISVYLVAERGQQDSEKLLRVADLAGAPSLVIALYSAHVLIRMKTEHLAAHRMMVLFRLIAFTLILFSAQFPLIFELVLVKLNVFACGPQLSSTENAKFMFYFVVLCQLCFMSILGTIMMKPSKTLSQEVNMLLRCTFLIICCIVFSDQFSCKIDVKIESKTDKKVRAQVTVPGLGIESNPMDFEKKSQKKKVKIEGEACDTKPWLIRTYSWTDGEWKEAKNVTAKFSGHGWLRVLIEDDLSLHPMDRFGVMCSEGTCG